MHVQTISEAIGALRGAFDTRGDNEGRGGESESARGRRSSLVLLGETLNQLSHSR